MLAGAGIPVREWDELLAGQDDHFGWPQLDEDDAALLCYTSGTTGQPKGVAYSHRSIWLHSMQICSAESFATGPVDRALVIVPMFHAAAWGVPFASFMAGASLVLPDRFLRPEPLAQMITTLRPTTASAVPTIWADLLEYLETHPTDISSLREAVIGGSACPPALMHAFADRYGVQVIHSWGMTETSPLGSVARPPVGVVGDELWSYRYRGPWISGEYLGDDGADPERFRDGWLRTGDVGTLTADGYLRLTDRAKDMIKSGGEWISSVELENAIMAHPSVAEACVVGVPDERWGERPLATVVLREGRSATQEELKEFLAGAVARWQVPERWRFVEAVPRTSVGKFDKKRVRAEHAGGALG